MSAYNIVVDIVVYNNNGFDIECNVNVWKSLVISTMFPCLKYKSYLYILHVQVLSQNHQLNSILGQMSGLSLCININAFAKVIQKLSPVAVLAFFSNSFFSGVTTRFVERPTLNSEGSHSGKFVLLLLTNPWLIIYHSQLGSMHT